MSEVVGRDIPFKYHQYLVLTPDGAVLSKRGKDIFGDVRWIRKFDISMQSKNYKKKLRERYEQVYPQVDVAQEEEI